MATPSGIESVDPRRDAALRLLCRRIDYERVHSAGYRLREFKLDRMRELLARLGNPHHGLPIVHVAGTKGKGSTAAMLGAVLSSTRYRSGVYTSPHLDRLEERIAVDGQPCSSEELVALVERVAPIVESMDRAASAGGAAEHGPTYFEITTAMALVHFAQRNADLAVLEVGLGGRLDSTNVCEPLVSIITSISFDHTRQLGNTLQSIAWEKAGIVKPGVPVVSGVRHSPARDVIRNVCRDRRAPLQELGVDFDFQYHPPCCIDSSPSRGVLDFHSGDGLGDGLAGLSLGLLGRHQAANAAVALTAIGVLHRGGWDIPTAAIRQGLSSVAWPARVELMARRPAVVVDAAHNAASVEALLEALDESFPPCRRLLVFAATQEKDVRGMIGRLAPRFDRIVFTRYVNNPRGVPPEQLAAIATELTGEHYVVYADPAEAWDEIRRTATPEDLVCVTGSFFIAAEMRHQVRLRPI